MSVVPTIIQDKPDDDAVNPTPNRHFLTETSFGVSEGTIQYQNIMLGGHIFTYGVSKNFSLAGGFELFNVFNSASPILVLSPKYSFVSEDDEIHFAIGGNLISVPDGGRGVFAGSIYGLTTFGNHDHNFTIGLGYGIYDGGSTERPTVQIGGMTRISKNLMIVADHILVSDNFDSALVGTFTLRFIWKKFNFDIGIGSDYQYGSIPVIAGTYIF